ncbi:MAG: type II CAAX endopeptidase family protein [Gemmatimonadota bacterium]|nr:type II CAAX endopeptidase family protein [Gemmatimonadota bacterium]
MDRRDAMWLLVFVVLGVGGLAVFLNYYTEAIPSASLDFKLSRDEVHREAQGYLENLGYDLAEYQSAQIFSSSQMQQVFLEQTLGLEETSRLAREWLSVWSWSVRWFKPLQKEELRVGLDPGGRVVGFSHSILESDEGASIAQDDALVIASGFLRDTQGYDLDAFELIDRSGTERKARIDHRFAWRKKDFTVGDDGHYRLDVVVHGDRVGKFSEYLKVPDSFSRSYREVRSRANLLTQVFLPFWLALGVAMLVILVKNYRRKRLHWQAGLIVGTLVAVAWLAANVNALPLALYSFDTTISYGAFLVTLLFSAVLIAAVNGGIVCLAGTAGGVLERDVLSERRASPLGRLSLRGLFSAGFLRSTVVGYGAAGAVLGYVAVFYLLGGRYFDVWVPADVSEYNNAFSTAIPWIYPLLVGLSAAAVEEFFFRLLAIPLLIRWLKRPWLAVLLPAIVWAFLHSNYPHEPIYIRGIEITVIGILFGILFLRFGIWAPIIAHYAINAFIVALPMVKSSSLYFQVSGVLVIGILLVPAIPAAFAVLTGRARPREVDDVDDEEAPDEPAEIEEPAPEPVRPDVDEREPDSYLPDKRRWIVAGLCAVAGIALMIGFRVDRFGARSLKLEVTRSQAASIAEAFCADLGLDASDYRRSIQFRSGVGSSHYTHLIRNAGVAIADSLMVENTSPWYWHVRWFKPMEKEEIQVRVDATGRVAGFNHIIPETRAGPELESDDARAKAEAFVEQTFSRSVTDTTQYKLLEARSEKEKERMDHHFVWERIDRKIEDGEFRLKVRVQGDEVGLFNAHYKAPEEFLRSLKQRGARQELASMVPVLLMLATLILAGVFFFRQYRAGEVHWRLPIGIGIAVVLLTLLNWINSLPTFFHGYDTSQAMMTYLGIQGVGLLIGTPMTGLAIAAMFALMMAMKGSLYPEEMGAGRWLGLLRMREGGLRFWAGTLVLAAAFLLLRTGTDSLAMYVKYNGLTEYLEAGGFNLPSVNTYVPLFSAAVGTALELINPFAVLALLLVWKAGVKRPWLIVAGIAVALLSEDAIAPARSFYHFAVLAGLELFSLGVLVFLVAWLIRFNLMAYIVAIWSGTLILGPGIAFIQRTTDTVFQLNGIVILALGLAPLLYLLAACLRERRERTDG